MTTMTDKLLQMAAVHEAKAEALRLAAAELNGHAIEKKKVKGIAAALNGAIALRAAAASGDTEALALNRKGKPFTLGPEARANMSKAWTPERRAKMRAAALKANAVRWKKHRAAQRAAAAEAEANTPQATRTRRTKKPARAASPARSYPSMSERKLQRQETRDFLNRIAQSPQPYIVTTKERQRVARLVTLGYVTKESGGYVRTSKEYTP